MMYTDGAQCTANFVFTDGAGNVYVGYAAHCAGKGAATDTNGCNADSVPLGTKVTFTNDGNLASEGTPVGTGTLAYSSWITERQLGTTDAEHLRLQRLRAGQGRRRPTSPRSTPRSRSGAARPASTPTAPRPATASGPTATPASVAASQPLSPHTGVSLGDDAADGGWSHPLYTVTPGIPGDSGSGFLVRRRQGRRHPVDAGPGPAPGLEQHR